MSSSILSAPVYFPDPAWELVKEFFFMKPILDQKRAIALGCVKARKLYPLCLWAPALCNVDRRSHPFVLHLLIKTSDMEWNYEDLRAIRGSWEDHYINIFSSPHRGYVTSGLNAYQLRKLLKMNGVKGYSKMKKKELIQAYMKI